MLISLAARLSPICQRAKPDLDFSCRGESTALRPADSRPAPGKLVFGAPRHGISSFLAPILLVFRGLVQEPDYVRSPLALRSYAEAHLSLAPLAPLRTAGIPHRAGGDQPAGQSAPPGTFAAAATSAWMPRRRPATPPTVAKAASASVNSSGYVTGTTAALSVLGNDAQGAVDPDLQLDGHQRARGRLGQIQRQRHQRGAERYGHLQRGGRLRHFGDDRRRAADCRSPAA